jgi:enediyne biosynthesis protein E4
MKTCTFILFVLIALFLFPPTSGASPIDDGERNRLISEAVADLAARDYASAVKKYKTVIDDNPADVTALVGLAGLYATADDPEFNSGKLAVDYALMAYDRVPGDLTVIEILADGYFAQSQFERAIVELLKCVAAAPGNSDYYRKLQRFALTWKGRLDINYPGKSDERKGKALFFEGRAAYHLGDYQRAVKAMMDARDLGFPVAGLEFFLARALIETDDAGLAIEILLAKGDKIAGDPSLLHCLGMAYAKKKDFDQALSCLTKARDMKPDMEGLLFDMGRTCLAADENVKALVIFIQALELPIKAAFGERRKVARIRYWTGVALERLGEADKALEMYFLSASALDGPPEAETALTALFESKKRGAADVEAHCAGLGRHFPGKERVRWEEPVRFTDVSDTAGVHGEGPVSWGDFDQDGNADLLVGGRTLFRNEGRGLFRDVTSDLGLSGFRTSSGGFFADCDNDGDLDLYIIRGKRGILDRLLRFDGLKRGFVDVTEDAGSVADALPTAGASLGDVNGDGSVDIYLANDGRERSEGVPGSGDSLFVNNGDGTFRNATKEAGLVLSLPRSGSGAAIVDCDNDGDMDIFVANDKLQPNLLWRNNGEGLFSEAGGTFQVRGTDVHGRFGNSRAVAFGDLDGDGDIDLVLANRAPLLDRAFADRSQIFLSAGRPAFTFRDGFVGSGVFYDEEHSNVALGDVDNDGDLDLFFTCTAAGAFARLYINDGKGRFRDATWLSGLVVRNAGGCAFADYDSDGDLDLFVGGEGGKLFENGGNGNHWIGFRLQGKKCNVSGISARITIATGGRSQVRDVSGGHGSCQDDMVVHFGLGVSKERVNVSIQWPHGKSVFLRNLKVDRCHTIKE